MTSVVARKMKLSVYDKCPRQKADDLSLIGRDRVVPAETQPRRQSSRRQNTTCTRFILTEVATLPVPRA